jgi:CDP-glycerol glycerophosphotransferase (TagB/SpsB family)
VSGYKLPCLHLSDRDTCIEEQEYSFDILRPLQAEARRRGYDVRWLLLEDASDSLLTADEARVANAAEAVNYSPHAVFAPGDRLPAFMPGLKVEVLHGINEDKRGCIYPERGLFDLYCTEGPARTAMLAPLADERKYFQVKETGWLKLDTLFNFPSVTAEYDRPQILYASTFSPSLSGADALFTEIATLSESNEWQWMVSLHPKMGE